MAAEQSRRGATQVQLDCIHVKTHRNFLLKCLNSHGALIGIDAKAVGKAMVVVCSRKRFPRVTLDSSLGFRMKTSRFSDESLVNMLSSVTRVATVRESHGISKNTFYTWKSKTPGMESDNIRKLKDVQSENQALKQIVAGRALLINATNKLYQKNGLLLPDFSRRFETQGMSVRRCYPAWH